MLMKISTVKLLLFYCFAAAIFTLLSIPGSTMFADDYYYQKVITGDNFWDLDGEKENMTELSQIIPSQINHYKHVNGRVVVHAIVQLYVNFLGYTALTITKVILMLLSLMLLNKLVIKESDKSIASRLFVMLLFFAVMHYYDFGAFFSCAAISLNYALPLLATLTVIYWMRKSILGLYDNASMVKLVLLFLVTFFASALHEGFSIPMLGAIGVYMLFNLKEAKLSTWIISIGYFLGTMTMLVCPANWERTNFGNSTFPLWIILRSKIVAVLNNYEIFLPILVLFLFAGVLFLWNKYRDVLPDIWRTNKYYMLVVLVCILFSILAGVAYSTRPYMMVGIMLTIVLSNMFFSICEPNKWKYAKISNIVAVVVLTVYSVYLFDGGVKRTELSKRQIAEYRETGYVTLDDEYEYSGAVNYPKVRLGASCLSPVGALAGEWTLETVAYHCGNNERVKFRPNEGSIVADNLMAATDTLKVYSEDDAWWIVIDGLDGSEIENTKVYATRFVYFNRVFRLLQQIFYQLNDPIELRVNEWCRQDGIYMVVAKKNNIDTKEIQIVSPDGGISTILLNYK